MATRNQQITIGAAAIGIASVLGIGSQLMGVFDWISKPAQNEAALALVASKSEEALSHLDEHYSEALTVLQQEQDARIELLYKRLCRSPDLFGADICEQEVSGFSRSSGLAIVVSAHARTPDERAAAVRRVEDGLRDAPRSTRDR